MDVNKVLELLLIYNNELPLMPQIIFAGMHSPFIQQAAIDKFGRETPTFVELALVMAEYLAATNYSYEISFQVSTPFEPAPALTNATNTVHVLQPTVASANAADDEEVFAVCANIPEYVWAEIDTL